MGALHLTVQSRCSRFDVGVANASILQVPVKFGLEFVAVIGANGIDPERELGNDVIHEVDRILLRMPLINLQGANASRIIDCGVLEIPDLAAFLPPLILRRKAVILVHRNNLRLRLSLRLLRTASHVQSDIRTS